MSAIVRETSEYVEMSDSITLCIVKDGAAGSDAVTYGVQVTPTYETWSDAKNHAGIALMFTKTTGSTMLKYWNVQVLGTAKVYVDGTELEDLNKWVNGGNNKIIFDSFTFDGTNNTPTIGTASVISIELIVDDKIVATANYANGKQGADGKGALEISVAPDTLVFDTNDDGIVSNTSKTATIACYRDGKKVTNVDYTLTEGGHPDCSASISTSNSTATVTISKIATDEPYGVSKTCGTVEVQVWDKDNGRYYFPTVKFSVNVAKFNGGLKADNKRFESKYKELTNDGSITDLKEYRSEILQSAREISLHVSEKRAGRRNLLPGSAFRKQGEGWTANLGEASYGIQAVGGVDGTNCVRVMAQGENYAGVFWYGGGDGTAKNVKVKRNTRYTMSVWAKARSADGVRIFLETNYQKAETGFSRDGGPTEVGNSYPTIKAGEWQLFTRTVLTDGAHDYMECNFWATTPDSSTAIDVLFCRPMLEEGDEYNGWTLSEQDYDYVGGNLLDNAGTLVKGGNLGTVRGTVTQNAFDGNSAVVNMVTHKLAGRVSTKTSLPASASYGDYYACNDTWRIWKYTGTTLVDNEHYNGFTLVDSDEEMLHNDFLAFSLELGDYEDYVVSWYAKGDAEVGVFVEGSGQEVTVECSDGFSGDGMKYGERPMRLTSEWKRYWAHFRKTKGTVRTLCFRQYRNDDNTASRFYLSQPKLEVGATMTEWTAKRSDMVDKQALYATGIDIKNRKIFATADNFVVRNNSGTPTFSIDEEGNIVGSGGASFNGPMKATTFTLNSTYFSVKEDGTITAKGGQISFFYFDAEGMASAVEYDSSQNKPWRGIGLSSDNISVSGYTGQRISSVFLGKGLIDSRFAGSDKNYIVHRVGTTSSASTFYNYIKLERFEDGHDSYENDPEYAALGIETQGDFCLAALGGPSLFAGMCFASNTGGSFSADKRHCFYLCSGGTFYMPSDPPDGMLIVVIQTGGRINFNGNKHRFRCGTNYSESCNSNSAGQWNLFYYDGSNWNTVYINGRPW